MDQVITARRAIDSGAEDLQTRSAARRNGLLKRLALGTIAIVGLAAAAEYGAEYWRTGRFMVTTDDAYVQADHTLIAPRVSGYISAVLVADNQTVKTDQVLARIDPRDYQTALRQAIADRQTAEAEIQSIEAQLVLQESMIEQAVQQLAASQAGLEFAQQEHKRYQTLARTGAATAQLEQQTDSQLTQQTAGVARNRAALAAARQQVDVLKAARVKADAQLEHYRAAEQQAQLNLGYTELRAPVDGTVGARTLRVGQYVQAGTQLMAVVPLDAVYVVANYKETQLTHVRPGQAVTVQVDGFPGSEIHGHVDSVAPATGLQFALLPPDNATGNFTKIVQRLPVKIALDPTPEIAGLLRPGMSVEPSIDTRNAVATSVR